MNPSTLSFTKSHGLGNDFILLDGRSQKLPETLFSPQAIKALCNRHRGVGADGVIFLLPSQAAVASLRIFNSDGGESEACGNGWRCALKYLWEHPLPSLVPPRDSADTEGSKVLVETRAGILSCSLGLHPRKRQFMWVEIAIGEPHFKRKDIPMLGPPMEEVIEQMISIHGVSFALHPVSLGNPHAVIFLENANQSCTFWAKTYGPSIEENSLFPSRVNVGFARKLGPQNLELAVWERGCGLTQACGTGACAAVIIGCKLGLFAEEERVTVHLPGGELEVQVLKGFQNVLLRGPAVEVYQGTIALQTIGI